MSEQSPQRNPHRTHDSDPIPQDSLYPVLRTLVASSPFNLVLFAEQAFHDDPRGFSQIRRDIAALTDFGDEFPIPIRDFIKRVKTSIRHNLCTADNNVPNPRAGERSTSERAERKILPVAIDFPSHLKNVYAGYAGHLLHWISRYGAGQIPIMMGSSNTSAGYKNSAPMRRIAIYNEFLHHGTLSITDLAQNTNTNFYAAAKHVNQLASQGIILSEESARENRNMYSLINPVVADIDLFTRTVPAKASLQNLYETIVTILGSVNISRFSADFIGRLLTANDSRYASHSQESLNGRINMVLRWIAQNQPDILGVDLVDLKAPHRRVSLNTDLIELTTDLVNAVADAEDRNKIDEGINKASAFIADKQKVTALMTDVYIDSRRARPEDRI